MPATQIPARTGIQVTHPVCAGIRARRLAATVPDLPDLPEPRHACLAVTAGRMGAAYLLVHHREPPDDPRRPDR